MTRALRLLSILLAFASKPVHATPEWAYPPLSAHSPSTDPALLSVPDSTRQYTQGQIDSGYEVADWYPDEHPPMPGVVAQGAKPPVRACAMCHLPSGNGHPESAGLAGLSRNYLTSQMRAYASGERTGPRAASMLPIVTEISEEDLAAAVDYFASLRPTRWTRIVESETAPQTRLGLGAVRYRVQEGGSEPLGSRIISVPENDTLAERRDDHSGFVEYVPPGSIARGRQLVERETGGIGCATCHGHSLNGKGDIPGIAGRLALVLFRGLHDIGAGARTTAGATAMRAAVPELSRDEMIAISAYLGTLTPGPARASIACNGREQC